MIEVIKNITGKTGILGIIGNPIGHSISPQLHNTISKCLGIDLAYVPFDVAEKNLRSAIDGFKAVGVKGFNVTIPYKNKIIDYLDHVTKEALIMGAVNTVKIEDGKLYGYNTDGLGFLRSFKAQTGEDFNKKKVVIVGAGGAARAIAVKVAEKGAREVLIVNRTYRKAEQLADLVNENISSVAKPYELEIFDGTKGLEDADIIVNTTSVGMYPKVNDIPVKDIKSFKKGQIVYDIIYNPFKTKMLQIAENKGCKVINGFGMLFYQGISAYEIWTGINISHKVAEEIQKALMEYIKIILI